jgi:hypothetical protein
MQFPSKFDFLEAFGIEPTEEDAGTAYCRYVKRSSDGLQELDISFSAVMESFQVLLISAGRELARVSSESVQTINIRHDATGPRIHVVFDFADATSEVVVTFDPNLHFHWWTLKNA